MNPYGAYANPYGAFGTGTYDDASASGGYQAGGAYPPCWWGVPGFDGAANQWGGDWGGASSGGKPGSVGGGGKDGPAKGCGGKGGGKPGKGAKNPVMCKFFLEGRCTRGAACTFSHGDGGAEDDEPSDGEMQASGKKDEAGGRTVKANTDDALIIENLQKLGEEDLNADQANQDRDLDDTRSNGSNDSDHLPPPASEAEIEEARQIVAKATREAEQRKKMKAKAQTASKDDLQAMINARLGMK